MPHIFNFPTQTEAYLMRALTHLHAGSGDSGYGVVDKTVQRDHLDGVPIVHSSSLKGALREAFEQILPKSLVQDNGKAKEIDHPLVAHIFGSSIGSTRDSDRENDNRLAGSHRFHEAQLLSLPVRSNVQPFFRATSTELVARLLKSVEDMGLSWTKEAKAALEELNGKTVEKGKPIAFISQEGVYLEDFSAKSEKISEKNTPSLTAIFGENLALFSHDDFKQLVEGLPVIARNYLENGISRNLWYEEVVPRETRFLFLLQTAAFEPKADTPAAHGPQSFSAALEKLGHKVQIGANASVGYGLCHFSSFPGISTSKNS